jgi:hypothetical protein
MIDTTQKGRSIDQQQHCCEMLICQCHRTILRFLFTAATASTWWRVCELYCQTSYVDVEVCVNRYKILTLDFCSNNCKVSLNNNSVNRDITPKLVKISVSFMVIVCNLYMKAQFFMWCAVCPTIRANGLARCFASLYVGALIVSAVCWSGIFCFVYFWSSVKY